MPRIARASVGGVCSHVINRGNGRRQVFFEDGDYEAFLKAIAHACVEVPMPVLALLFNAQSLSSRAPAGRRRRSEPVDALVAERARPDDTTNSTAQAGTFGKADSSRFRSS